MSKRNLLLFGFVLIAAAQLAVPTWMIINLEWTLQEGQVYKFRTRPVDPADAFRGRYVSLSLEPEFVQVKPSDAWTYNQKGYAVLGTDTNGFVMVKRLTKLRPAGETAVPVHTIWVTTNNEVHIQWPGLESYYMPEGQAPAAEAAYLKHNRRANPSCHVTVRVRGETAVIENLYIDDQPIRDWLHTH